MEATIKAFCEKCKAEQDTKFSHCPDCGTKLTKEITTPPGEGLPISAVVPEELGRNIKQLEDKLVNMATTDDIEVVKGEYTKALDELQRGFNALKNRPFDTPGSGSSKFLLDLLGSKAIDLHIRQLIESFQRGRARGKNVELIPLTKTEYWKNHYSHVTKDDWLGVYKDYFTNDAIRESFLNIQNISLKDALDTVEDADLVPEIAGDMLWKIVRDEVRLANLLPFSTMIGNSFTNPIMTGTGVIHSWNEQVEAKNPGPQHSIRGSKPVFSKVTWILGKLIQNIPFSYELEEDAIIELIRVLKEEAVIAMAEELGFVLIRGDIETGTGLNINATGVADDVTATAGEADSFLAFDGIDKEILKTGTLTHHAAVGALTIDNLYAAEQALGVFGLKRDKTFFLVNIEGWIRFKSKLTQTQDFGTMGPQATILSGQLGSINGYPIIVDEQRVNTESGEAGERLLTPVTELPAFNLIYAPGCPVKTSARGMVVQDWDEVQEQQRGFVSVIRADVEFPYSDQGLYMGYDIAA